MKIYILCSVRNATDRQRAELEAYTSWLEEKGHEVHLPHRDTNQQSSGLEICMENGAAIAMSDEVHIFYDEDSMGSHFDLGMVFALDQLEGRKKRVRLVKQPNITKPGKSFHRMIGEWIDHQNEIAYLYPNIEEATDLDFEIPFFE